MKGTKLRCVIPVVCKKIATFGNREYLLSTKSGERPQGTQRLNKCCSDNLTLVCFGSVISL